MTRRAFYDHIVNSTHNEQHLDASVACTRCHATVDRWVAVGTRATYPLAAARVSQLKHDWLEHHPCIPVPTQIANAILTNLTKPKKAA